MLEFLRYKFLHTLKPRSFNKRTKLIYNYFLKSKYSLNFFSKKQNLFEFIYFKQIKIFLKPISKNKYSIFRKFFFCFYLQPNLPISLKGKNSRMGKGIGKFTTWKFLVKANSLIFSISCLFFKKIFFYIKLFQKRVSKSLNLFFFLTS